MEKEFQILKQIKKVEVPARLFEKIKLKIKDQAISEKFLPISWAAAAVLIIVFINAIALSNMNKTSSETTSTVYSSSIKLTMYD